MNNHRTSAKLDELVRRYEAGDRYLNSNEGRALFHFIGRLVATDPKFDALTLWLAREGKKGRVGISNLGANMLVARNPEGQMTTTIPARMLSHWADFVNADPRTNHTRRGVDIMQHDVGSLRDKVEEWDQELAQRQEQESAGHGKVVFTTPDGWTIRQLTKPDELRAEGDNMGHCVGGYHPSVQNGTSMIYSLRDPQGKPHATIELEPHYVVDTDNGADPHDIWAHTEHMSNLMFQPDDDVGSMVSPYNSEVVQIQGKQNQEPRQEYKDKIRQWFESMPESKRPTMQDYDEDSIYSARDLADWQDEHPHPNETNEYGLTTPEGEQSPDVDWDEVLNSLDRPPGARQDYYEPYHGEKVYEHAKNYGKIHELAPALERYQDKANQDFLDAMEYYPEEMQPRYDPDDPEWDEDLYYDQMNDLQSEHPASQAASHMYQLLKPHWNPETEQYEQEPYQPPQSPPAGSQPPQTQSKWHPRSAVAPRWRLSASKLQLAILVIPLNKIYVEPEWDQHWHGSMFNELLDRPELAFVMQDPKIVQEMRDYPGEYPEALREWEDTNTRRGAYDPITKTMGIYVGMNDDFNQESRPWDRAQSDVPIERFWRLGIDPSAPGDDYQLQNPWNNWQAKTSANDDQWYGESDGGPIDPNADMTSDGEWYRGRFQLCPECRKRHPKSMKCPHEKFNDPEDKDTYQYPYPGFTLAKTQLSDLVLQSLI